MSVKDRLKQYLKIKNLTHAEFEEKSELSTGFVSSIGKGINTTSLGKIKAAFPDLNTDWLQTGEGEWQAQEIMDLGGVLKRISATNEVMLAAVAEILAAVKNLSATSQRADLERMVNEKLGVRVEPAQKSSVE